MSAAKICAWILTSSGVPQKFGTMLMAISPSPFFFITLVVIFLALLGFFIEGIAIMIMFVPVLAPIAGFYGLEAHHFGMIFVMAVQIATITPPVCISLYVTTKIAGIRVDDVLKEVIPFWFYLTGLTLIVAYWPGLSMWLPKLLGYIH